MLEHVPAWLGNLLTNVRAGHGKLMIAGLSEAAALPSIELSSPAFPSYGRLPERFTADGEGVSPPLVWGALPVGTRSVALIVEDPDAPAPEPLVHVVLWGMSSDTHHLAEGVVGPDVSAPEGVGVGRNSFGRKGWLPPDPPTGHGRHDYVFQLFALDSAPALPESTGRTAITEAIKGHVLAVGVLVAVYSRGEAEAVGEGVLGVA